MSASSSASVSVTVSVTVSITYPGDDTATTITQI